MTYEDPLADNEGVPREALADLAASVRWYFDVIEQTVPPESYLVGGAVRDTILGIEPNDYDFVVVDETPASMKEYGFERIDASSFPVYHDSAHNEWALARTETSTGDRHDQFEAETDDVTLRDDLYRRDLTINAMALDPYGEMPVGPIPIKTGDDAYHEHSEWGLFDPTGGVQDCKTGVLKHVDATAFVEDPLRILRLARYAARFSVPPGEDPYEYVLADEVDEDVDWGAKRANHQFAFDRGGDFVQGGFMVDGMYDYYKPEEARPNRATTIQIAKQSARQLNRMSRDRIGAEIKKALETARAPDQYWAMLEKVGALAVLWPDLDRSIDILAGPMAYHYESDLFKHTLLVTKEMAKLCNEQGYEGPDRVRRLLMAVAHDVGKVPIADRTGGIHSNDPPTRFGDHPEEGADRMEDVCRRLGLGKQYQRVMEDACEFHMDLYDLPDMMPKSMIEIVDGLIVRGPDSDSTTKTLPTNDDGDPVKRTGATIWELLDLIEADHSGRLQLKPMEESEDLKPLSRRVKDVVKSDEHVEDHFDVVQPELDRERYDVVVEAVYEAIDEIGGHAVMINGACDEHRNGTLYDSDTGHLSLDDDEVHIGNVLTSCDDCWSPGPWIGDEITSERIEYIQSKLLDGA